MHLNLFIRYRNIATFIIYLARKENVRSHDTQRTIGFIGKQSMALGVWFHVKCADMGCKFACVVFRLVLLLWCMISNCGGK
jgi:hypothetical protein